MPKPRQFLLATCLMALLLSAIAPATGSTASAPAPGAPALRWPAGEAAQHARAWFEAFNQGEEAMRAVYQQHYGPAALANRPIEDRLARYREMKSNEGTLMPIAVPEILHDGVTVVARTGDGRELTFHFECEAESPHRILGIRVEAGDGPGAAAGPGVTRVGGGRAASGPPLGDAEAIAAMQAALTAAAKADSFSGTVLLARDGRPLMRQAWGQAERRFATPNRVETRYNLGSINKLFTKLAIAQLAEQGKLKLDDPLTKYFPDWPGASAAKITIAMLVAHRAGIPDFFNDTYDAMDRSTLRHNRDYIPLFRNQPLWFEPGTSQRYSNGSYVLLGEIIAKASGQDYYDYLRDHVWKPAGMLATGYPAADEPTADVAMGYSRGENGKQPLHENIFSRPARGSAAGGGYSTVDDLLRFDQALFAHKLCSPGWTEWVIGGPAPTDTRAAAAASGARPSFGFAGGAPGISAEYVREGALTLVVLGNLDPPYTQTAAANLRAIMRRMKCS